MLHVICIKYGRIVLLNIYLNLKKKKICIYFKFTNNGGKKYSDLDAFENVYGRSQEILNNYTLLALFIVRRRKNTRQKRGISIMKIFGRKVN